MEPPPWIVAPKDNNDIMIAQCATIAQSAAMEIDMPVRARIAAQEKLLGSPADGWNGKERRTVMFAFKNQDGRTEL